MLNNLNVTDSGNRLVVNSYIGYLNNFSNCVLVIFWPVLFSLLSIIIYLCTQIPSTEHKIVPKPHKPVRIDQHNSIFFKNTHRLLEILPQDNQNPRDLGLLFFCIMAFYMAISRFSYEYSRSKLRERGDAIRLIIETAQSTIFSEKMPNGEKQLVWEVSECGMWIECNIKDPKCNSIYILIDQ